MRVDSDPPSGSILSRLRDPRKELELVIDDECFCRRRIDRDLRRSAEK